MSFDKATIAQIGLFHMHIKLEKSKKDEAKEPPSPSMQSKPLSFDLVPDYFAPNDELLQEIFSQKELILNAIIQFLHSMKKELYDGLMKDISNEDNLLYPHKSLIWGTNNPSWSGHSFAYNNNSCYMDSMATILAAMFNHNNVDKAKISQGFKKLREILSHEDVKEIYQKYSDEDIHSSLILYLVWLMSKNCFVLAQKLFYLFTRYLLIHNVYVEIRTKSTTLEKDRCLTIWNVSKQKIQQWSPGNRVDLNEWFQLFSSCLTPFLSLEMRCVFLESCFNCDKKNSISGNPRTMQTVWQPCILTLEPVLNLSPQENQSSTPLTVQEILCKTLEDQVFHHLEHKSGLCKLCDQRFISNIVQHVEFPDFLNIHLQRDEEYESAHELELLLNQVYTVHNRYLPERVSADLTVHQTRYRLFAVTFLKNQHYQCLFRLPNPDQFNQSAWCFYNDTHENGAIISTQDIESHKSKHNKMYSEIESKDFA